jgi:hypothetical protein
MRRTRAAEGARTMTMRLRIRDVEPAAIKAM